MNVIPKLSVFMLQSSHFCEYIQKIMTELNKLKSKIRDIPDFPSQGILFKDITPLLQDPDSLKLSINSLIKPFIKSGVTAVAGMEARGFIFGSLAASALGVSFIPLRKPGKLPFNTHSVSYALEYGEAKLEIHTDAIQPNDNVLLIDDVLATGGTMNASCQLIEKLGGKVVACAFVIELTMLNGRENISDYPIHTLIQY